ncbi:hypothetical protein BSL78_01380 [Apostichopus japonicus]|uniref:DUF6589 domain-containing protein n=1 Tax=Stichopus japonicus TaxID=307972 RepID=A0A2G8LN37_STIJA|nr:hypothetical protein BSL78_01380 [Apostichopus japonicus]
MSTKRKRQVDAHHNRSCKDKCEAKNCDSILTHSRVYHISNFEQCKKAFAEKICVIQGDSCICCKCYQKVNKQWKGKAAEDVPVTSTDDVPDKGASTPEVTSDDSPQVPSDEAASTLHVASDEGTSTSYMCDVSDQGASKPHDVSDELDSIIEQPPKKAGKAPCLFQSFDMCDAYSVASTSVGDWPTFAACMGIHKFDPVDVTKVALCRSHYMKWYDSQRATKCGMCQKFFSKKVQGYTVPELERIKAYYKEIGDKRANLTTESKVCMKCLKEVSNLRRFLDEGSFLDQKAYDLGLSKLLDVYQGYVSNPANPENIVNLAIHHAVVYCIQNLSSHTPFLLSDVYAYYKGVLDDLSRNLTGRDTSPLYSTQATLLSKLLSCLGDYMRSSTIRKEPILGTMLWRKGDDAVEALLRQLNVCKNNAQSSTTSTAPEKFQRNNDSEILQIAATTLNKKIHNISKTFKENTRLENFSSFDIDSVIQQLPPIVWNFFCVITQTETQRAEREYMPTSDMLQQHLFQTKLNKDSDHRHKLRTFFGLCHAVYTHDDKCGYPIHTLLGETVHGLGGSDELVRILNRFGIVSSLSKIRDYELDYIYMRLKKYGWGNVLSKYAFSFATVDNVDKSSVHASVKAGGGPRGIHATSYQIVEPQPTKLTNAVSDETSDSDMGPSTSAILPSIFLSDAATQKSQSDQEVLLPPFVTVKDIDDLRRAARPCVTWERKRATRPHGRIDDFTIQPQEQCAVDQTVSRLIAYATAKHCTCTSEPGFTTGKLVFPDINIICPSPAAVSIERSNVHYIGVLNEHADNINTIKEVVETLHEEIVSQQHLEYLVVVGDGKTYAHLVKLKHEHSVELDWMIPFPGDWHVLKNIQPVLMKIYWHAGLMEMASTVHKGATLASLFYCSNFRRTHDFIILAWEALLRTQISSFCQYVQLHPELQVNAAFINEVEEKLKNITKLDATTSPQLMI